MATFESSRLFPYKMDSLAPVAQELMAQLRGEGFEVAGEETLTGGWHISVHKGGMFKAVFGLKSALKVSIEPTAQGIAAKAGVGVWGQQAIPTLLTLFVAWPVLIAQIWGLVQQSRLDDQVLDCIGKSVEAHGTRFTPESAPPAATRLAAPLTCCTECGASLPPAAKFCPGCGSKILVANGSAGG